ncbi:hypothetical protein CERZMDRAFT_36088 [Cercospora zeae-maydis SCOH1-5]|uniref:Secreted protein n=1 Tax=Cercospora zeae-maydis SCOH1-5 TaxID=717836 RepID=A0A6A6FPY5_9PEZI|nr:hypothetical protein CERZMDRAFT_36088 [Cercospora zeae-maydis SCOH1-5]
MGQEKLHDNSRRPSLEQHDISSPIHYTRDPRKLIGYLIPFPKPQIPNIAPETIPPRFLIYTPPPPPFMSAPREGEKESKAHKVQRKWLEEVREAKTSNAKTLSWKGLKGKATKGISWGMSQTKGSSLEFLNRIGERTVRLEEMVLVHTSNMPGDEKSIREEFVNTMLRSKSKAERDAIIATGLLPVSFAMDMLMVLVWPFGGLLEIDAVWLYASVRGAKVSRSVTKRLSSTSTSGDHDKDKLHLTFAPSPSVDVLERYLAAKCHEKDSKLFPTYASSPSESEVLEAIGWFPSSKGGVERNWEDEQWEIMEVKDDLKSTMAKGAKEWAKWCKLFAEKPEKALKK